MEKVSNIIIHCSDSSWGSASEIRKWHIARGWKDIGYHFVILNGSTCSDGNYLECLNGSIESGRKLDGDMWIEAEEIGAHTLGYNGKSIGICVIGKTDFTPMQKNNLLVLVRELQKKFNIPSHKVLGHCEADLKSGKTCPNMDMKLIRERL